MSHTSTHIPVRSIGLLLGAVIASTLIAPSRASAQETGPGQAVRLNAYGILRSGGGWDISSSVADADADGDMEAGGGVGLRVEFPLGNYVAIGPLLEYAKLRTEDIGGFITVRITDYHTLVFGAWIKARYMFDVGEYDLELYLGMPFGLAAYFPTNDNADNDVGVSVGLLGGAQFFFSDSLGVLFELGFRRDGFRDDLDRDGERDRLRAIQFAMNMGLTFAF